MMPLDYMRRGMDADLAITVHNASELVAWVAPKQGEPPSGALVVLASPRANAGPGPHSLRRASRASGPVQLLERQLETPAARLWCENGGRENRYSAQDGWALASSNPHPMPPICWPAGVAECDSRPRRSSQWRPQTTSPPEPSMKAPTLEEAPNFRFRWGKKSGGPDANACLRTHEYTPF